jgi:hypothetical protein
MRKDHSNLKTYERIYAAVAAVPEGYARIRCRSLGYFTFYAATAGVGGRGEKSNNPTTGT